MKKIQLLPFLMLLFVSFNTSAQQTKKKAAKAKIVLNANDYALFGDKFELKNILTNKQMLEKFQNLKKGDTLAVKFQSDIKAVCKKKGCWMEMDLTGDKTTFVKFKDYGFFVPKNADNSVAIVDGVAFLDIETVDELKHYAKDAGKSQAEIDQITKPKVTYAFTANGVYIKK